MDIRPLVIAHRGASGYLPEHTAEAKALAYGMGADYLEQDVVATRDAKLIVMHDITLDAVTDVAAVFPGRARSDGRHYAIDFDLAEIRRLRVVERRRAGTAEPLFPRRFASASVPFRVATLGEEIELVQGLNRTTGKQVGIYPEIKEPRWHREHGIDLSVLLLEELAAHGYDGADAPVFVQCFDTTELERVRVDLGSSLPLIQLLPWSDRTWQEITAADAAALAARATGVGLPHEQLVVASSSRSAGPEPAPLAAVLRSAGLSIHVYTFRADQVPAWASSFRDFLHTFLANVGVDGVFCDHPDVAVEVRDSLYPHGREVR
jgi:glycerophosphoryl diester phosphodiesterase